MVVKFDRENFDFEDPESKHPPWLARAMGGTTCVIFGLMALLLGLLAVGVRLEIAATGYIHCVHFSVFNELLDRY